ncbi:E3 ubiquitin-protein ligase TRIM7-like isoform X3 [Rhea pennata]|uniref:E3 ubiquitin-protein ligase TRIM7-like isoform X3 n=1 Tax=Rhea pennata TaxID=8795 RepID=UPI002E26ADB1
MASNSSSTREEGEEAPCRTVPQQLPDPGNLCRESSSCGGCTARSQQERGRFGDAEGATHRSRLRKGNFQAKLHLTNLVEKLKLLGLGGDREEKEHLCLWRNRTLTYKGDVKEASSSCDGQKAHGVPTTACVKESAQENMEQARGDLENLKKQREELLELKMTGERQCQDYLMQTEAERQKIVSEFRQLRRFLKEQELVLLARLGELDKEIMRRQEEEEAKMAGRISLLNILICEMERSLEQPPSKFMQDGKSTVNRWEKDSAWRPTEPFLDLEQKVHIISQQNIVLEEMLRRFQDILPSELEKGQGPSPGAGRKAFVTLDPDTANAWLILSRDRRGARWTDARQHLPSKPQRFDMSCCVLSCQGFASGRHCWEVEVADGGTWAVGVARESVRRKGWVDFLPEEGIWAIGLCGNQYRAFTSPATTVPANGKPRRIQVSLDYGGGQVAFYFSGQKPPVFTFQKVLFGGESIFSFFWVGRGSRLQLCP